MPEKFEEAETAEFDFKEVKEVKGEDAANQLLNQGWKLVDTFEQGKGLVYVLGLPKALAVEAKRPRQRVGLFGLAAFAVGVYLIWFVMGFAQQGFLIMEFDLFESAVILVGVLLVIIGLSQMAGMIPPLAEHMK
jgi:hypothetical protein